jgi:hypothetical protein
MSDTMTKSQWSNTITINSFDTDSDSYEVLYEAAYSIVNIKGLTCEIGVRAGGSSKIIVDAIMASKPPATRTHIGIDPYGGIDYNHDDKTVVVNAYENKYRDIAIPALFRYCVGSKVNFQYYQMTDTQYMKRFDDGVPVYLNNKEYILNTYALVFFDGPHTTKDVMSETKFFGDRAIKGSIFVYDDVTFYDHNKVDAHLKKNKWRPLSGTNKKLSYIKES